LQQNKLHKRIPDIVVEGTKLAARTDQTENHHDNSYDKVVPTCKQTTDKYKVQSCGIQQNLVSRDI